jgi:hypothetical protein
MALSASPSAICQDLPEVAESYCRKKEGSEGGREGGRERDFEREREEKRGGEERGEREKRENKEDLSPPPEENKWAWVQPDE